MFAAFGLSFLFGYVTFHSKIKAFDVQFDLGLLGLGLTVDVAFGVCFMGVLVAFIQCIVIHFIRGIGI